MPELDSIEIQLKAENKDLKRKIKEAEKELNKFGKETKKVSKTAKESFANVANSVAIVQGPLGPIAGRLSAVSSAFGKLSGAAVAGSLAFAGFVAIVKTLGTEISRVDREINRIDGLVKATGSAAGLTVKQLDDFARQVAANTLASTSDIRAAEAALLTFKSVSSDVFKRAINLSEDLAEILGTKPQQAALQLGKALEDPKTGLNSLRRAGVSFTQAQKDVINSLVDTGQEAKAMDLILKAIEGQMKGTAEAAGRGLAGALDLLSQRFHELLEQLARTTGTGDSLTSFFNTLARGAEVWRNALRGGATDAEIFANKLKELGKVRAQISQLQATGRNPRALVGLIALNEKLTAEMLKLSEAFKKNEKDELDAYNAAAKAAKERKAAHDATIVKTERDEITKLTRALILQARQVGLTAKESEKLSVQEQILTNDKIKNKAATIQQVNAIIDEKYAKLDAIKATKDALKASIKANDEQVRADKEAASKLVSNRKELISALSKDFPLLALDEDIRNLKILGDMFPEFADKVEVAIARRSKEAFKEFLANEKTWQAGAILGLDEYLSKIEDVNKSTQEAFTSTFKSLEDSLVSFVTTGKLGFGDLVKTIEESLARIAIQESITGPLAKYAKELFQSGGGGKDGGSIVDSIGAGIAGLFGFRAGGGDVQAGMPYVVGEKRAEVFVPRVNGTILPDANKAMKSMGKTINVYNNVSVAAPNGSISQQSLSQLQTSLGLAVNRSIARNS